MIEQSLFFGDTNIQVVLPDRTRLVGGDGGGPRLEPVADQDAAVRAALAEPLALPRVGQLVRPGARVLIASDAQLQVVSRLRPRSPLGSYTTGIA